MQPLNKRQRCSDYSINNKIFADAVIKTMTQKCTTSIHRPVSGQSQINRRKQNGGATDAEKITIGGGDCFLPRPTSRGYWTPGTGTVNTERA